MADTTSAGVFVLEPSPAEHIVYSIDGKTENPAAELKIKNPTEKHQLYKVKCTSNDLFKIRPPVGMLKTGEETTVKLTLQQTATLPENDTHYFSVYCHETDDTTASARDQWKGKKEQGRKRIFVRFEKTEEPK